MPSKQRTVYSEPIKSLLKATSVSGLFDCWSSTGIIARPRIEITKEIFSKEIDASFGLDKVDPPRRET